MNKPILILGLLLISAFNIVNGQRNITIHGVVTDTNNKPIPHATIAETTTGKGDITADDGSYKLVLPKKDTLILQASFIGYQVQTFTLLPNKNPKKTSVNFQLTQTRQQISDVVVKGHTERVSTLAPVNIKSFSQIPTISGNVEDMIKMMPGVSSSNELSSQYSVRGGSFDENLIYVNGIEIYRPLLVQSAKQEGLSFVNPDMVSSINFSAGGFNAEFGDKMSSVLDIKYHRPDTFKGKLSASLLGSSLYLGGKSKNSKFTHSTGVRYKTTKYVLGTLDTKGEYVPTFVDVQSYLTYDITKKLELSLLGNVSLNQYTLVPKTRDTQFGTIQQSFVFRVFYEGQEEDKFDTYMGALSLNYRVNDYTLLTLRASAFNSFENIAYDILGEYSINVATGNGGVKRDSLVNIGIGGNLDHGRFELQSEIYAAEHQGLWNRNNLKIKWGAKWQVEQVHEYANQWTFFDSAGYALPYVSNELQMTDPVSIDYELFRHRINAFIQSTYSFSSENSNYMLTLGVRGHYSDLEENLFFSPRGNLIAKPYWAPRLSFHLASGIYHQPPFYKELRDYKGNFYKGRTQRSTHLVMGMDFNFRTWNRPFTFTAEAYYKSLDNITPYKIDDVQVIYMPNFKAKGYATGLDFKVYGEFVPGLESWFSLSILETKEDVYNDEYRTSDNVVHRPGYYSRPSDQLVNMAVFFQDYFPLNPKYKVHLTMNLTTGLPYTGPSYEIPSETFPLGPYKRVDIGFSRSIKREKKRNIGLHDIWLSVEVLNLFDVNNKVSYDWINTVENNEGIANVFSVPNNLTRRRFNVKISASL